MSAGPALGWQRRLPALAFAAAVTYSLVLQGLVPDRVFFSGDGGDKALIAKQLASGALHCDRRLPADTRVQRLWDAGFYPFRPPYDHVIEGRHYMLYPCVFPMLTAPLHAAFGVRGLYLLPLLSLWVLWLVFLRACRRLGLEHAPSALALVTLAFATPLSFYSATYWEHVPAVTVAFAGLSLLIAAPGEEAPSAAATGWGGVLVGASVWLREEMLCLCLAVGLLACAEAALRGRDRIAIARAARLLGVMLATVGGWLGYNVVVYGHPFGTHAFGVLERFSLGDRIANAVVLAAQMWPLLLVTLPLMCLVAPYGLLLLSRGRSAEPAPERFLVAVGLVFTVAVPFVLPAARYDGAGGKQWGPRFLLLLAPIACLVGAHGISRFLGRGRASGRIIAIFYAALVLAGVHRNTVLGTAYLSRDYRGRVRPLADFLDQHATRDVVVADQYMSQELIFGLPTKSFFLVHDLRALEPFVTEWRAGGHDRFLYVRYAADPDPVPLADADLRSARLVDLGQYGIYRVYEAVPAR